MPISVDSYFVQITHTHTHTPRGAPIGVNPAIPTNFFAHLVALFSEVHGFPKRKYKAHLVGYVQCTVQFVLPFSSAVRITRVRASSVESRVASPEFRFRVASPKFRVRVRRVRVPSSEFRVPSPEFRVPSSEFRVRVRVRVRVRGRLRVRVRARGTNLDLVSIPALARYWQATILKSR